MPSARALVCGVALAAALAAAAPARAQDRIEVRDPDTVRTVLERLIGKRVALVTRAGPELTGTVVKVGAQVVHLGELGGREFFDAVVSLEHVQAVVVRARK